MRIMVTYSHAYMKKNGNRLFRCPAFVIHYSFPVVVRGLRDPSFAADIFEGTPGFDGLQNGDNRVFGESGFAHGVLLRDIISMPEDL